MDEFSEAVALAEEEAASLPGVRLGGVNPALRLFGWRVRQRCTAFGRRFLRVPASLRNRFLLFAVAMVGLVVVQGVVGWSVAERNQEMNKTSEQAVRTLMSDLDLLRTIKSMQISTLVSQNLVSTGAADDPATTRIDLHNLEKAYRAAHARLVRIVTERHMITLGAITDLGHRIDVAKSSFDDLAAAEEQAVNALASADGKVPPALALQIGGRVDGLYEHLDRMGEGVNLLAEADRRQLSETAAGSSTAMRRLTRTMMVAAAIGLLACIAVSLFVLRGILRPLSAVADSTRALADGNIRQAIPEFVATEIAAITRALAVFRANLMETARLKAEQEAHRQRAEDDKRRMMEDLASSFEVSIKGVVGEVATAAAGLRETASALSRAADDATGRASAVSCASEQAAINVETVASAAEQLSASIQEISGRLNASAQRAAEAVGQADQANGVVSSLAETVQRIGTVVNLIGDIASRTQMLSLNATIEAARAGEYGKGFAVVANEVKVLATQTATATAEIAGQIDAVQVATKDAVAEIAAIAATILHINEISQAVAAAMEQQGAATREISRSVQQASAGTHDVSSTIVGVTRTAQAVGEGAGELLAASATLSRQSDALNAAVETFLLGVRGDGLSLRWGDDWLTGIPAIDAEHRTLVQMVNDLGAAMTQGKGPEALAPILDRLADYTVRHFANEEDIWAKGGLPDLDGHRRSHAALVEKVTGLRADLAAGRTGLSGEVMAFLRRWLIEHVFKTDKVAARRLGADPTG